MSIQNWLWGILLSIVINCCFAKNHVSDYQRIFLPVYAPSGELNIAIRVFEMNSIPSFLIVDPASLETRILPIHTLYSRGTPQKKQSGYSAHWNIASTRYYQLLRKSTAAPYLSVNQGIIHADKVSSGNVLSIDLCPSTQPFEADFFNKLVDLANKNKQPVPITIAISGMWMLEHPNEFQWLRRQAQAKKLSITWANHSFSHVYYNDLPDSENFMMTPSTNMDAELLLTEKYLLEENELPSVFFRFPGLASNKTLVKQLRQYGLIPLGTDAWLADMPKRHQNITAGGILLVHGNSNEHQGIVMLTPLLSALQLLDIKSVI